MNRSAYLDSCIVIYRVERVEPWYAAVTAALSAAGATTVVVSELVWLETLVKPIRDRDPALSAAFLRYYASLTSLPFDDSAIFDRAAALRAEYRLKTPDALHLACAIHHGCAEFWTNDHRLDLAAADEGLRVRVFEPASL